MLLQKRKKKRTIVFVCTGNTCRSPMARGLLLDWLEKNNMHHIDVKTAGVMTIPGLLPTQEAVQVMDSSAINIRTHRSAPLTPEMLRKADLVLGMTPFHVQFALRMSPEARGKTFLLKEYTKSDLKNYQITDPMGATLEVYKRVYREIKLAIDRLVEMDVVLGPLDQDLRHEKYVPPKAVKEPKAAPIKEKETEKAAAPAKKAATVAKPAAPAAKKAEAPKKAETPQKTAKPQKAAPAKAAVVKPAPVKHTPPKPAPAAKAATKVKEKEAAKKVKASAPTETKAAAKAPAKPAAKPDKSAKPAKAVKSSTNHSGNSTKKAAAAPAKKGAAKK